MAVGSRRRGDGGGVRRALRRAQPARWATRRSSPTRRSTSSTSATPHPMHHEDALLALRAGKHVLVEKPFTMNAAEAEELVAEARARGLFLMEAMWARFLPHMREVRRLLAEGALGEIVTVHADHGQWFAEDRRVPAVRARARRRRAARPRDLPGVVRLDGARRARPGRRRSPTRPSPASTPRPRSCSATRAARTRCSTARCGRTARRGRRSSAPRGGSRSTAPSTSRRRSR